MYSKDFVDFNFLTLLEIVAGSEITHYNFHYDVAVRAKDGKVKVYIDNLNLINSVYPKYDRPLLELYKRRVWKDGTATQSMRVLIKIKKLIKEQIASIAAHAEYVRLNDTWEANTIKWYNNDDDW